MGFTIITPPGSGSGGDGTGPQAAYVQLDTHEVNASEALSLKFSALALLLEAITIEEDVQNTLTIIVEETAELSVIDTLELTSTLLANLLDTVDVYTLFRTPADVAAGWVMNTEGAMPISEYSNFVFNSLAYHNELLYGASDDGLYLLDGDTDNTTPITAELSSMMLDFATSRMKRIRAAYLGYTSTNELVLKVRSVSQGLLYENWYKARPVAVADAPREGYVRVGHGLRSRYWQFELTNVNGGDFEIDQLELYPLFLNRRV